MSDNINSQVFAKIDPTRACFFDLSAELRNKIYDEAIISDQPIIIAESKPHVVEPVLLRASKRVRAEALPLFYGSNTFISPFATDVDNFLKHCKSRKLLALLKAVRCRAFYSMDWVERYVEERVGFFAKHGLADDVVAIRYSAQGIGWIWATRADVRAYKAGKIGEMAKGDGFI